ncbi:MAG: hypothetical protein RLZZ453_464 [Chlamydiota bacterium]|jgi:hypothetical protein
MIYWGLSLENEVFRASAFQKKGGKLSLETTVTFPLNPEGVQLFYNHPLFASKKPYLLSSLIDAEDLFIRKLILPLKKKGQIKKTLPFQLESILPTPSVYASCVHLLPTGSGTSITLFCVEKEKVDRKKKTLEMLGLNTSHLCSAQSALFRFARWSFPEENRVVCIDVRKNLVTCCVIEKEEILLSQTVPLDNPCHLVEGMILFLKQKGILEKDVKWLCTGDPILKSYIKTEMLKTPYEEEALSLGTSLDYALFGPLSTRFCEKSYAKEKKGGLLRYIASCLAATVVLAISSSVIIHKKEKAICALIQEHIPGVTPSTIEEKLVQWESTLKGKKADPLLLPNVPKVTDVLSYLSTHPALTSDVGEAKEGVEIQSIHYQLTKFPKVGNSQIPYVAQLDIDLKSEDPRLARDFHDALLKADPFVNHKKEIKWHTHHKMYHTSFELSKWSSQ